MNAREVKIIRGYVQSLPKISGREDAAKVAVVTDDGAEYRILHKGAGISLVGNINANVEVTGSVLPTETPATDEPDAEGTGCVFVVKSYRLTDGFDDPWYDDTAG